MDIPKIIIPDSIRLDHEDAGDDVDLLPHIPTADPADIPPDGDDSVFDLADHLDAMESPLDVLASSANRHWVAVSGLVARDRAEARKLELRAMSVLLRHPGKVHYTQDAKARWSAINGAVVPWDAHGHLRERYLHHGDCSSTNTWIDWLALHHHFHLPDIVNGEHWHAGFTGTMILHGRGVTGGPRKWKVGDNLIYGPSRSRSEHTTKYIGGGMVFSHGSEGGPYKLPWNYRSDMLAVRRPI